MSTTVASSSNRISPVSSTGEENVMDDSADNYDAYFEEEERRKRSVDGEGAESGAGTTGERRGGGNPVDGDGAGNAMSGPSQFTQEGENRNGFQYENESGDDFRYGERRGERGWVDNEGEQEYGERVGGCGGGTQGETRDEEGRERSENGSLEGDIAQPQTVNLSQVSAERNGFSKPKGTTSVSGGGRRRLSFADESGKDLVVVYKSDSLHYSAAAAGSNSVTRIGSGMSPSNIKLDKAGENEQSGVNSHIAAIELAAKEHAAKNKRGGLAKIPAGCCIIV